METPEKSYGFEEVYLLHNKCIAKSRKDCDPSVILGGMKFKVPAVPANMKSVINQDTCVYLAKKGWFYIMHRFGIDNHEFTRFMHDQGLFASISIGVNNDSYNALKLMKEDNVIPEFITLDIANAFSVKAESMIKFVKDNFGSFLIAGNYATEEAVIALEGWGADATKTGISGGSACTTYYETGMARGIFSTILECSKVAKKPIIGDGGVACVGDLVKGCVAGATMGMAGNMFSGYSESAGKIIEIEGKRYKEYFGSASYNNTLNQRNVEGKCILVEYRGEMEKILMKVEDGFRSAISYAGGLDISALRNVRWGVREGGVRR